MHSIRRTAAFFAIIAACVSLSAARATFADAPSNLRSVEVESGEQQLTLEILDDSLLRFSIDAADSNDMPVPIDTTPMIVKRNYAGPLKFERDGDKLRTEAIKLRLGPDAKTLQFSSAEANKPVTLRFERTESRCTIVMNAASIQHLYGLGEQFITPGEPNGDWTGRTRIPGNEYGNRMIGFDDGTGAIGNAEFPVLFGLTEDGNGIALLLDDLYPHTWDFTNNETWSIKTPSDELSGYIWVGDNPEALRQRLMSLTGRPPVPPKSAFGLWVSEYGFDNWAELDDKLKTLRDANFPLDGFVLDLQWFGGITSDSEDSQMGSLTWDLQKFPQPAAKIAALRDEHGLGVIVIEESYVSKNLPVYNAMAEQGFLVRAADGKAPAFMRSWWGAGGMVDWTHPQAGDYWHDNKRQPLIDAGVVGHWADLGEPEDFVADSTYHGFPENGKTAHRDVANIYNFRWAESIARGYERNNVQQRPFIMTRSGTLGIQRFGTALWSGDIGSRLGQLSAHANVQLHMTMSGIDYFGADVGGFKRPALNGPLDELYTQWFAFGSMFDIPVRPHAANVDNQYETAPDRVGHLESNLNSIRRRYEMVPYLYSLAHEAYRSGTPIVAPMMYAFPRDQRVREMGDQKMIGPALTAPVVARHSQRAVDVYLPQGAWVNVDTGEWVRSAGEFQRRLPLYDGELFSLPLFARAGALVPLMHVDDKTMNVYGRRTDGSRRDELVVCVATSPDASNFTLYEDDGRTIAYQTGAVRTTQILQQRKPDHAEVIIEAAKGNYEGAPAKRAAVIQLHDPFAERCHVVLHNGTRLPKVKSRKALDETDHGWLFDRGRVIAKAPMSDVTKARRFEFKFEKPK